MAIPEEYLENPECTKVVARNIKAFNEYGSISKAAKELDVDRTSLKRSINRFFVRIGVEETPWNADYVAPSPGVDNTRKIKEERDYFKSKFKELKDEVEGNSKLESLLEKASTKVLSPPKWLGHKKNKKNVAIATMFLSDTHFDEVVHPDQINYVNAYNRDIAQKRLKKFFENGLYLGRDFCSGVKIEGLVLALGGDMVSGNIHDELAETNEAMILPTCLHWSEQITAGIQMLLEFYPKIHVPCVTGNHGRQYKKPRHKFRAETNYDWLIFQMVKQHMKGEKRVTFDIPLGSEARWAVYKTRYQMTHGDQFRGGNGIGGIAVPILRGALKKYQSESATNSPFDILLMGHFHQLMNLGHVMINGALKGFDEYASQNNFSYEEPAQWFFLTDPDHGRTITAPIRVKDREHENWDSNDFEVEDTTADWMT